MEDVPGRAVVGRRLLSPITRPLSFTEVRADRYRWTERVRSQTTLARMWRPVGCTGLDRSGPAPSNQELS
ncbi:hypothetical protein AERO9AM_20367 [Aeromicrobium sp. 9AM]|nr:hypothetical protein AERO9AM_20367 [Aeromicrobium sp. 9AM]